MTTFAGPVRRLGAWTAATLADPPHHRVDTRRAVDEACRRLAAVQEGSPELEHETQQVTRPHVLLDGLEQYWLSTGVGLLARLREHLRNENRQERTPEVSSAARLVSEHADCACPLITDQELIAALAIRRTRPHSSPTRRPPSPPKTQPPCCAHCATHRTQPKEIPGYRVERELPVFTEKALTRGWRRRSGRPSPSCPPEVTIKQVRTPIQMTDHSSARRPTGSEAPPDQRGQPRVTCPTGRSSGSMSPDVVSAIDCPVSSSWSPHPLVLPAFHSVSALHSGGEMIQLLRRASENRTNDFLGRRCR
jgi:hypothetical protein